MSRSADVVLLAEVRALRAQLDPASRITPIEFPLAVKEFLASHGQLSRNPRLYAQDALQLPRYFPGLKLHEVGVPQVQGMIRTILDAGRSRSRCNRLRSMVSKLMNWGIEQGYVLDNPVRRVKKFRESVGRTRYLKPEEIDRLMAACDKLRSAHRTPCLKQFILTAIFTGGRRKELINLRWQDIDFDVSVVTFRAETTKSGKLRQVPLATELADYLLQWRKIQDCIAPQEYIFSHRGNRFADHKTAFKHACQVAGIVDFRIHDLRHCFASNFMQNGGDLYRLQKFLGHSTSQLTERYSHLSPRYLAQGMDFIGIPGRVRPPAPKLELVPVAPSAPLSLLPTKPLSEIPARSLVMLRDLSAILRENGPRLRTVEVLARLGKMKAWRKIAKGDSRARGRDLAAILRPLGIKAAQIGQRRGGPNTKGYRLEDLAPAIVTYLQD